MSSSSQCAICLGSNCFLSSEANDIVEESGQTRECDEEAQENIPGIVLTICSHVFCKPCIASWFLHQENGQYTLGDQPLTCPECRAIVNDEDIVSVLDRPLRHVVSDVESEEDHPEQDRYDEMDEFTLAYLESQAARKCPDCGIWIIRGEGCESVMCRCGCRFCFCCGNRGNCSGSTFFNNIILEEEEYEYDWDPETESVAGMLVPLFATNLDFYPDYEQEPGEEDWYDYWFPPTVEHCPYRIMPLFEGDWYIDGNIEIAHFGVNRMAEFWRIATRDPSDDRNIPSWYVDVLQQGQRAGS